MSLTQEQIKHLAKLCKLQFTNEELEKFGSNLNGIVDYVSKLDEIDNSILEKYRTLNWNDKLVLRPDVANSNISKKDMLSTTERPIINDQIAIDNIMN